MVPAESSTLNTIQCYSRQNPEKPLSTSSPTEASKSPSVRIHLLSEQGERRTYVLAFRPGDEVVAGLNDFTREHHISCAHFTAIGAFSKASLAWYDMQRKAYREIAIDEPVEVVSCIGNATLGEDDSPIVHAHCAVSDSTGKTIGGHLLEGHVSATLEVFLVQEPTTIRKVLDSNSGLKLIE